MPKTIVVCDDEIKELNFIVDALSACSLKKHTPLKIVKFTDAQECLEYVLMHNPYAVFLDVYIGENNGCEVGHKIRRYNPDVPLVFITSSTDFAVEAFNLSARHYLIKPVTLVQLEEALERLGIGGIPHEKLVELQTGLSLPQSAIVYLETIGRQVAVHINNGQTMMIKTPMSILTDNLDPNVFLKCHRSFLVNMAYIANASGNDFFLKDGTKIPIRINGTKETRDIFYNYLFESVRN